MKEENSTFLMRIITENSPLLSDIKNKAVQTYYKTGAIMTDESEAEIQKSQEQLGKAIERAKMGEDRNLAARIRDLGERLVRTLYGLLKMTEIHELSNKAFEKPITEFNNIPLF